MNDVIKPSKQLCKHYKHCHSHVTDEDIELRNFKLVIGRAKGLYLMSLTIMLNYLYFSHPNTHLTYFSSEWRLQGKNHSEIARFM